MQQDTRSIWDKQFDSLMASIGTSFLFGVLLLYTMEIWWTGMNTSFWLKISLLLVTLTTLFLMGYYGGLSNEKNLRGNLYKTFNALAIGIIAAIIGLLILNRISLLTPLDTIINMMVILTIPFAIGAFLADSIIPGLMSRSGNDEGYNAQHKWKSIFQDISSTIIGGIFITLPIVPSEEVPILASETTYWHDLSLIILSLIISYIIVFASSPRAQMHQPTSFLQKPLVETVLSYSIALILSFILLTFFGQISWNDPAKWVIAQIIILSFPFSIGGAAGRLAI